jgi:hypothetical protein
VIRNVSREKGVADSRCRNENATSYPKKNSIAKRVRAVSI